MQKQFVILGAGISGLSNAFHLFKKFPKSSITIIEKSNRVGGSIHSSNKNGFITEQGPRSLRVTQYCFELYKVIDEVGLSESIVLAKHLPQVCIYWDGSLKRLPQQLDLKLAQVLLEDHFDLVRRLPSIIMKSQIHKYTGFKQSILEKDISVAQYLDSLDSSGLLRSKYGETLFYGIYGCSVNRISAQLAIYKKHINSLFFQNQEQMDLKSKSIEYSDTFKMFFKNSKMSEAKSFRFSEGLQMLPLQMLQHLKKGMGDNFRIIYGTEVQDIGDSTLKLGDQDLYFDNLFINLPINQLKQLVNNQIKAEDKNSLSTLQRLLNNIATSDLNTKNICYKEQVISDQFKGNGYLVNPSQKQKLLGVLFDSLSYPSMVPVGSSAVSFMALPQDTNLKDYLSEFQRHLNLKHVNLLDCIEYEWPGFAPKYDIDHFSNSLEIISSISRLSNGKISIGGNVLFTPAIPELVLQSKWIIDGVI